jgi:myo-inositol-1(or 4)-monophosphatase
LQAADLTLIADAIRMAGRVATSFVGTTARRWDKPGGAGPVTEADLAVNDLLHSVLRNARPEYGWLSEETEDNTDRLSRDTVFIIDPIDGTRSFVEGSDTWAHSVAIAHKGVVTAGAIFLPLRGKLYTAAQGGGAFLNGVAIKASDQSDMKHATVLAARPATDAKHWHSGVPAFERAYRPSLAYRMSLVAEAEFDAMLTFRPTWEWDVAAGALIVTEAGGRCTDTAGAPLTFNNTHPTLPGVMAGGSTLHGALLQAKNGINLASA